MEELTKRKGTRLKNFDYSSSGAYFVTICVKDRLPLLSKIVASVVGDGASTSLQNGVIDTPRIQLTEIGKIVEKNLLSCEKISGVKIDDYVIMPDHIHAIILICFDNYITKGFGTSRAPSPTNNTLSHVVSAFKRFAHKEIGEKIFQRSFYDHIIRDREDYDTRKAYIYENPIRWFYDKKD